MSNTGGDMTSFLLKAAPLIALFIVPPLDRSPFISLHTDFPLFVDIENLLNEYYNIISKFITKRFIYENLIFSEVNFSVKGKWWCALSYMGVHGNYEHLFNNFIALLMTSTRLYKEVGIGAVYQGLISGGVLSVLNSNIRGFQLRQRFEKWFTLPFSLPHGWLQSSLQPHLESFSDASLNNIVTYTRRRMTIVGCSGGVMALQGMSFALDIDNLIGVYYYKVNRRKDVILPAVLSCAKLALYLRNDVVGVFKGANGIDHGGHLTGFCWGVMFFGVFYRKYAFRKRRHDGYCK